MMSKRLPGRSRRGPISHDGSADGHGERQTNHDRPEQCAGQLRAAVVASAGWFTAVADSRKQRSAAPSGPAVEKDERHSTRRGRRGDELSKRGRSSPTSEKAQSISVERRARTAGVWGRSRSRGGSAARVRPSVLRSVQAGRSHTPSNRGQKTTPSDGVSSSSIEQRSDTSSRWRRLTATKAVAPRRGLPRNAGSKTSR